MKQRLKGILLRLPRRLRGPLVRAGFRAYEFLLSATAGRADTAEHDGLRVPPPKLRVLVTGKSDVSDFLSGGERNTHYLRDLLSRHGRPIEQTGALLDFGCGCGRMLRWWRDLPGEVHGCDYNPRLVEWVEQNLPFVRGARQRLTPPLPYASASFDFVYALSIFTHLTEANSRAWLTELTRITRPGGLMWVTIHGAGFRNRLLPAEQRRFDAGELIVHFPELEGTNACSSYWPPRTLERLSENQLTVLEQFDPGARPADARAIGVYQDAYLLRRD